MSIYRRGDDTSGAVFSRCEQFRYVLWRKWDLFNPEPVFMAFIGLNPSTADETQNDPTIRRCIAFAKREGYAGLYMLNLFAYRATFPKDLYAAGAPAGDLNNQFLADYIEAAGKAVGGLLGRWGGESTRRRGSGPAPLFTSCQDADRGRNPLVVRSHQRWASSAPLISAIQYAAEAVRVEGSMKAHELITNPKHFTLGTLARDSKGKPCGTAPDANPVSFDCLGAIFWAYPNGKHREVCAKARELAKSKYDRPLGRLDHEEALAILRECDV